MRAGLRRHWPLFAALAVGLLLRLVLWGNLPRLGLIGDEAEYLAAADWLAVGRGFAWHTQYLWTRAPLYPLFVASHVALFGRELWPIFLTQSALSLLNVALVYWLAWMLMGRQQATGSMQHAAPGIAALLTAIYLPLATYGQLLLSETLFITLLLGALLCLGAWASTGQHVSDAQPVPSAGSSQAVQSRTTRRARSKVHVLSDPDAAGRLATRGFLLADVRHAVPVRFPWLWLASAGGLLGLATLTRGLTLGFVPIVGLWVLLVALKSVSTRDGQAWKQALIRLCILTAAFCFVLLPWSLYASRAYGGTILVDTTGAYNLALGARTAFDGGRSDEPTRNFVLALLDPALSEQQRTALLAERRDAEGRLVRGAACLYAAGDERLLAALERPAATISQGERQQLLTAEARCLLAAEPSAFVLKSLREFIDLFKINYTGAERLSNGFALGRLPYWYLAALFLLDDTLYVLILPLAVLGWAGLRAQSIKPKVQSAVHAGSVALIVLIGLWLLYHLAAAPLLFAINRFRVPLMPFAFILAAYALAMLPQLGALLRTRYGALCGVLAGLLLLVAVAPYAYLEPRAPGADSRWASYLGPYPSSLANSAIAWAARPGYLREQELAAALGAGEVEAARAALAAPELKPYSFAVGAPLLDGLEGRPAEGLDRLAALARGPEAGRPLEAWQTAVVAGELFRQLGDREAARRELNPELVDRENPVAWAWQWLYPPRLPADRIALADDNDLGYIKGFYLGEFDPALGGTVRWASGATFLRFPGAATGAPRELCLLLAAAWPTDLTPMPVTAWLDDAPLGQVVPGRTLQEHCLPLPEKPAGAAYVIELRAPTFVPDALDLLKQQGPLVGQLRQLAFQLDAAEVR